jgi:hypothetical protein
LEAKTLLLVGIALIFAAVIAVVLIRELSSKNKK